MLDEEGRPSFQRLQRRAQQRRTIDVQRASLELPATYYAFDLLGFEGFDLRPLPLVERKRLLQAVLPRTGPVRFLDHIEEQGEAFYAEVSRLKLEGLIAKRKDAPYRAGRSPHWLKLRAERVDDFVVVGFTEPQGGRAGFGALHLAAFEGPALVYCGRAGSGFDDEQLVALRDVLEADRRGAPPCTGPLPADRGHVWVEPRLVAEVRYLTWTDEGLLRQPVFRSLRDDKRPEECVIPRDSGRTGPEESAGIADPLPRESSSVSRGSSPDSNGDPRDDKAEKRIPFSNLAKVFWPDEGYTKGDLIEYYRAISPWLLPYLRDRLLVLTRFPDGIGGKSFFQKDAPSFAPGWVRLERVWSESAQREIDYFVAGDVESLLYIANLGTIPLHVWGSRITDLAHPDWCILDLDPKGAPFLHVVQVARGVHELVERDRPARLREDVGLDRPPRPRAARGALHLRAVQAARGAPRPGRGRAAPGDRHDDPPPERPRRARLHRLPAERPRQAAGRAFHRASRARSPVLGAAPLGRGGRDAGPAALHDPDAPRADVGLRSRPAGAGPDGEARSRDGARPPLGAGAG